MGLWEAKEPKKVNQNNDNLCHQGAPVCPGLERPQSPSQNQFDDTQNQRKPSQENTAQSPRRGGTAHARDAANNLNDGGDEQEDGDDSNSEGTACGTDILHDILHS